MVCTRSVRVSVTSGGGFTAVLGRGHDVLRRKKEVTGGETSSLEGEFNT